MTEKIIGNDDINGSSSTPANYLIMQRFAAASSKTVSEIRIEVAGNANVMVCLYSDNAGNPNVPLTYTGSTAVTTGFNTIAVTPYAVTSGTYYWLACIASAASSLCYNITTGTNYQEKAVTFSGFTWQNPPSGMTAGTVVAIQMAGWGDAVSGRMCQVIIC